MSFDQLSNMESGGGGRRSGGNNNRSGGAYSDSPEFARLNQTLTNSLFHLQGNNDKLRTEIDRLGTRQDKPRLRERVQALLEESRDQFKEVGEGVKKLQTWDDPVGITPTQKYQQQKLARDFGSSLREFQGLQRTALEKLNASVTAAKAAAHDEAQSPSAEHFHGGEQLQQLQQQEQAHLAAQDEVDFQDALIQEREDEIRQIEEGVTDLNTLFKQVAQIVGEQGEQLETIETNAINVRDDTRGADVELRSAARYQKNARSKACCLLLILAVILTIVLLAVFLG
ncbi:SNARE domain-containing protein [Apiospora saccharicola]|uniref:SNARE domain-containing protein n=1 Tax=Apiospora saccharicola TaxID=335842 RepID=A0ABR1W045_9PEZI